MLLKPEGAVRPKSALTLPLSALLPEVAPLRLVSPLLGYHQLLSSLLRRPLERTIITFVNKEGYFFSLRKVAAPGQ
jgi:hypothetical protein